MLLILQVFFAELLLYFSSLCLLAQSDLVVDLCGGIYVMCFDEVERVLNLGYLGELYDDLVPVLVLAHALSTPPDCDAVEVRAGAGVAGDGLPDGLPVVAVAVSHSLARL
jgi:hypothetical protein